MLATWKARGYLKTLADRLGWRHDPKRREALGLHRGVCCYVQEWDGILMFVFGFPNVKLPDEAERRFEGFVHYREAGLPMSWLECRDLNDTSCTIELDTTQLDALGDDRLAELPDLIARDYHAMGGTEEHTCTDCRAEPATEVTVVDQMFDYLCLPCRLRLAKQAPTGSLTGSRPTPEAWGAILPRLFLVFLVGAAGWSLLMQLAVTERAAVGTLNPVITGFYGVVGAVLVLAGQGVTFGRSLAIVLAVSLAIFLGNVWGYRQFILQGVPDATWGDIVEHYGLQLTHKLTYDKWYLLAGGVGAGIGIATSFVRRTVTVR